MKKTLITVLLFISCAALMAQFVDAAQQSAPTNPKRVAITVGFLQGGGSLIGADLEFLVTPKLGLQIGGGYVGFGGGINYHLKPAINSSFVSLGYWHQGIGETFAQDALGGLFTFRANKLLSASLGPWNTSQQGPRS